MGLALIAGRGALPEAVIAASATRPLVCGLETSPPDRVRVDRLFRLERLGGFMRWLRRQGVAEVCLCGAVDRPRLIWRRFDLATLMLVPQITRALGRGDDGALRIALSLFERAGFSVLAAHEAAPGLLPDAGVLTRAGPPDDLAGTLRSARVISADQARRDLGQAAILRAGACLAREAEDGTDAMLARLGDQAAGAILFKAPKPGQDRRADLPVIGPETARGVIAGDLSGIVIAAGGVIVLERTETCAILDRAGKFLWVWDGRI